MKNTLEKQKNGIDGLEERLYLERISSNKSLKRIKSSSPNLTPLFEIYEGVKTQLREMGTEPKYRTGLTRLDEVIWGVHRKQMLTIGARTSQGKTSLALHITKELVDVGNRVIYFSLEESKEEVLKRLLCNFGRINNLDLREGKANTRVDMMENAFLDWIRNIRLLIDDKYGFEYANMVKICKIIKPDFVVVDYIQMISIKGFRTKLEAIEEYIRCLKQLAIEMDFGIILLSQINRQGAGGEAEMIHLKWAGMLEEHSETVLLLSWQPTPQDKTRFYINVDKQKHGSVKDRIQVSFLPQYSRFED